MDAIHSILDRMGKADGLARKNRTEIMAMDGRIKAI